MRPRLDMSSSAAGIHSEDRSPPARREPDAWALRRALAQRARRHRGGWDLEKTMRAEERAGGARRREPPLQHRELPAPGDEPKHPARDPPVAGRTPRRREPSWFLPRRLRRRGGVWGEGRWFSPCRWR